MRNKAAGLQLHQEVLPLVTSVVDVTKAFVAKFKATFDTFPAPQPCEEYRRALMLVGLNLESGVNWDARSDIFTTRLLGTLLRDVLRAHTDGAHDYDNGAWVSSEEIPEPMLRAMGKALSTAQNVYVLVLDGEGCGTRLGPGL